MKTESKTTAAANQTLAERLIHGLASGGVGEAVVSPGSRNTPLVLALRASQEVRAHTVLDERVAGFVALGLARTSGRPVALVCTSGSAGAHYLPALVEARASRVPLVAITADRPPELQRCGAPQTVDQSGLFAHHALDSLQIGPPGDSDSCRALETQLATLLDSGRGGAVHINVAFRKPLWDSADAPTPETAEGGGRLQRRVLRVFRDPPRLGPGAIGTLANVSRSARRGAIVLGPRAPGCPPHSAPAFAHALTALAKALGWPILAGPTSQVRFGAHDRRDVVTNGSTLLRTPAFADEMRPDFVLRFGQTPTSTSVQAWVAAADRALLVDPWGDVHDPSSTANMLAVADPTWICRELLGALVGRSAKPTDWLLRWRAADALANGVLGELTGEGSLWGGSIVRSLVESLPNGSLLHVAGSMSIREIDAFAPTCRRALTVQANRGANGIDGTLGTAFGASLTWPGACAVLCGDLALLHDAGALLAARGLGARATIVVVNNGGGGIFSYLPIAGHPTAFEEDFLTPQAARIDALCAAARVPHERIDDLADLPAALEAIGALRVVEVCVDREHDVARHRAAWEAVGHALEDHWSRRKAACPSTG